MLPDERKIASFLKKKKERAILPEERDYLDLCEEIYELVGEKECRRLLGWEECEYELDFLGFLEQYQPLRDIPEDFTILDLGSYMGIQGAYFKNHTRYITVDIIPEEVRLKQDNATHIQCELRRFLKEVLPALNLDFDKTIAIDSYVPCNELRKLMEDNFVYYKWVYPGEGRIEVLPEKDLERE